MKTIIINGSPKAAHGNTEVFITQFLKGMTNRCEVAYVAKTDRHQLARYIRSFDTVLFVMPLYIHAMPGIVMKLIECMESATGPGKSMGFLVQSGFMESAQSQYLERYLRAITKDLNYAYLGTVIRGGSAGISMMPESMNKKLFKQLNQLGACFERNGTFDRDIVKALGSVQSLSKGRCFLFEALGKVGLSDAIFWNGMLKNNKAFERRFDRPFV
jgi:NAD(P)H-dependent FMN reductase